MDRGRKHRQALLEGLRLSETSKTVNSAAVKPEEIGQEEEEEILEGVQKTEVQELGGDAKLNESGQVGRAMCREGDVHEDGELDTRKLAHVAEGMRIQKRNGEGDVGDAVRGQHDMV